MQTPRKIDFELAFADTIKSTFADADPSAPGWSSLVNALAEAAVNLCNGRIRQRVQLEPGDEIGQRAILLEAAGRMEEAIATDEVARRTKADHINRQRHVQNMGRVIDGEKVTGYGSSVHWKDIPSYLRTVLPASTSIFDAIVSAVAEHKGETILYVIVDESEEQTLNAAMVEWYYDHQGIKPEHRDPNMKLTRFNFGGGPVDVVYADDIVKATGGRVLLKTKVGSLAVAPAERNTVALAPGRE